MEYSLLLVTLSSFHLLFKTLAVTVHNPEQTNVASHPTVQQRAILCQDDWPSVAASSEIYCSQTTVSPSAFTHGYNVTTSPCATPVYARSATALSTDEARYVDSHADVALPALREYLSRAFEGKQQYDVNKLLVKPPRIGMALSGGGFRAMLTGAGVMKAFKRESTTPTDSFRGLLDASLYISGLSGGSWAIGSWATAGFPSIDQLVSEERQEEDS